MIYTAYEASCPDTGWVTEIQVPTLRRGPDGTTVDVVDTYHIRTFDDFKCFRHETGLV